MPKTRKRKGFVNFNMPIQEGLEWVMKKIGGEYIEVTGSDGKTYRAKGNSLRLRTFKETGTMCPICEAQATHWVLTFTAPGQAHLNLMGNRDVLFTHDHIVPLAQGGEDRIHNTHTMCGPCNWFLLDKNFDQEEATPQIEVSHLLRDTTTVFYHQKLNLWRVRLKRLGSTNRRPKYAFSDHATLEEANTFAQQLTPNPTLKGIPDQLPPPRTDLKPSPLYCQIMGQ